MQGLHGFLSGSARKLMSWATSSGSPLEREAKARPAHVSAPDPYTHQGSSRSGTLLEFGLTRRLRTCMHIGVWCPSVEVRTPRYILGCVVFSCHVAPFGLPMRWGQAPSSAWPRDVAWVRRLHAVEEGTPDLGYRQKRCHGSGKLSGG